MISNATHELLHQVAPARPSANTECKGGRYCRGEAAKAGQRELEKMSCAAVRREKALEAKLEVRADGISTDQHD